MEIKRPEDWWLQVNFPSALLPRVSRASSLTCVILQVFISVRERYSLFQLSLTVAWQGLARAACGSLGEESQVGHYVPVQAARNCFCGPMWGVLSISLVSSLVFAFYVFTQDTTKMPARIVSKLTPAHLGTPCFSPNANSCWFPRSMISSSSFQGLPVSTISRRVVCSPTEVLSPPDATSTCNPFGWNTLYSCLYLLKFFLSSKSESKY